MRKAWGLALVILGLASGCSGGRGVNRLVSPASEIVATSTISKLSPDGRTMAVVAKDDVLWVISEDDGSQRRIAQPPANSKDAFYSPAEWSPDGQRLAYVLVDRTPGPAGPIYVYEMREGKTTEIGSGSRPRWVSPDWLLYDTEGAHVIIDVSNRREVTRVDKFAVYAFLPTTRELVLARADELYLAKVGQEPFRLGTYKFAASSPDGRWLWLAETPGHYSILDVAERRVTRVRLQERILGTERWSPSGTWLAIFDRGLWVVDRDGKVSKELLPYSSERGILEAKWRDDRYVEMVLVERKQLTRQSNIYFAEVDVEGNVITKTLLYDLRPVSASQAQWVPGGKRIYLRLDDGLKIYKR